MELTIDWLVNQSSIQELRCVAGEQYLSNRLSSINVIDNCDVLHWINKDEFAITTGYCFKDNEQAQTQIVRDLKQAGGSGLGIKLKRFFDHIPQCMIDTANEVGLPLIEIPYYYRFADIISTVFVYARDIELKKRNFGADMLRTLTDMYYNENGIDKMISFMSETINGICMLSQLDEIISVHIPDSKLMSVDDLDNPSRLEIKEVGYGKTSNENICYYSLNENIIPFMTLFLPGNSGKLLIDSDTDPAYITSAKCCLHLLSLELERNKNLTRGASYHDFYGIFYEMLLGDRSRSNDSLRIIYDYYGFDYKKKRVCITVRLQQQYAKQLNAATSAITDKLKELKTSYFICSHLDYINIFVYYTTNTSTAIAVSNCIDIGNELFDKINSIFNCDKSSPACIIGIGRCHKHVNTVATAFQDSMQAVRMSAYSSVPHRVSTYFSQMPFHVLSVMKPEELRKIYNDSVKQLADFDRENGSELIPTLRAYISCKFNVAETAKKLFLHRNTLAHRLDKIKSILCVDMTDIKEIFSLYLALCAMDLLEEK